MADVYGGQEELVVDAHHHLMAFPQQQSPHHSPSHDSLHDPDRDLDSDDADDDPLNPNPFSSSSPSPTSSSAAPAGFIDPEPYVSNQFYTFNRASYHLMVQCIRDNRYASPDEIRVVTPPSILVSWRGVWKDRNEDTAYSTGWKRVQDRLHAQTDEDGNEMLYFKNNSHQFVPHINQWQNIVLGFHGDADLKHFGLKETIERIKQVWTVGAKFYGIPETYIKVCVASCPVCCVDACGNQGRSKRRRFEYTESFEVLAKDVPLRLQQLAAKHQVVLCIRQKYIRYKPFLAEVKDYCCHRAGEPNSKKAGVLKRKRYTSKRCGCGFRIRAIVPITNYSEKEKTFTYQEEGQAIFKLYAIHSGHEPGPHEGSARIIHRLVGPPSLHMDNILPFDQKEEQCLEASAKDEAEACNVALQQVHELSVELQKLEGKLGSLSHDVLSSLSQDLTTMIERIRNVEDAQKTDGLLEAKCQTGEMLLNHPGLDDWGEDVHRSKEGNELVHDADPGYVAAIGSDAHWNQERLAHSIAVKGVPGERDDSKWMDAVKDACSPCDSKSLLVCEQDGRRIGVSVGSDASLIGMPVDNYYQDNVKWYEGVSCTLEPSSVCADDLSHAVQAGFQQSLV